MSRRSFMAAMGAAVVPGAVLPLGLPALGPASVSAGETTPFPPRYLFFDDAEARFIEAACARLIPADSSSPGALAAGVPAYLDAQLAGPWGAGRQPYRSGQWQPGTPTRTHPLPGNPAQLFRTALGAIEDDLHRGGMPDGLSFGELSPGLQDRYLRHLESGGGDLGGVPSSVFFQGLLTMTVEGFFTSPCHGGVRDRIEWRMHGFPGAFCAVTAVTAVTAGG